MLRFHPSHPSMIAAAITGHLSRKEIETFLDRVEARLELSEPTHLFIEVEDFSGFEMEGLGNYVRRLSSLIGKLGRLGRVAVVANQRWLRWAAKVESALLPNVCYETFTPDQRDQAFAWVEGRSERRHASAIKLIETNRPDVAGFELDGKLGAAELEAVTHHFESILVSHDHFRLLGRIRKLEGAELSGLLDRDFLRMKSGLFQRVERYALVGGPRWLAGWIGFLDALVPVAVRHFEADEEAAAWEWLGAAPTGEAPLRR